MALDTTQLLHLGCRMLAACGVFDVHGNLSARTAPDGPEVAINGSVSPATATPRDFATFDVHGGAPYPDGTPGETPLHAAVYRARDDVQAVCHHHAPYAVAVASAGVDLRPVHPNGAVQAGAVAVYEDVQPEGGWLVTTDAEGERIADLLGDDRAVMLRGHGAVVVGESIADAVVGSAKLEYNARLLHHQATIGEPWYLPEWAAEEEAERVQSEFLLAKSLDYYLAQLG